MTMHGFALNCDVDLGWYDRFVPAGSPTPASPRCPGRRDRVPVAEVIPSVERHLTDCLAWAPYTPTPDYEPRPEPGRVPRIERIKRRLTAVHRAAQPFRAPCAR